MSRYSYLELHPRPTSAFDALYICTDPVTNIVATSGCRLIMGNIIAYSTQYLLDQLFFDICSIHFTIFFYQIVIEIFIFRNPPLLPWPLLWIYSHTQSLSHSHTHGNSHSHSHSLGHRERHKRKYKTIYKASQSGEI